MCPVFQSNFKVQTENNTSTFQLAQPTSFSNEPISGSVLGNSCSSEALPFGEGAGLTNSSAVSNLAGSKSSCDRKMKIFGSSSQLVLWKTPKGMAETAAAAFRLRLLRSMVTVLLIGLPKIDGFTFVKNLLGWIFHQDKGT